MTSFTILNKQEFDINPIQEFRRVAGGLPDAPKRYKNISSNDKKKLLWNFFQSDLATDSMLDAKTVYSGKEKGATIRELVDEMNDGDNVFIHSIEHVVPKSTYEDKLEERFGERKSNGASVNPLNFLPSHRTINSKRGTRLFDFDGDTIESETLANVDGMSRRFQAGKDNDGEWVVEPLLSRGDIARCVMYMEMMYELAYVNEREMNKLKQWMKEDEPSNYERAFGLWLSKTQPLGMDVQNPFVSNPELATDENMFQKLLNSYLKNDPVVVTPPTAVFPPPTTIIPTIVIDSVLPNPPGTDIAGKELVTLRNTTRSQINLDGWTLRIFTKTNDRTLNLEGFLFGREVADFIFNDDNVLSNSRQTTITLSDGQNNLVSEFQYAKGAARTGTNERITS